MKYYFPFVCFLMSLFFSSCSSKNESTELLELKLKTAETLPIDVIITQLQILSDNDVQLLSRVTKASPSTLERLKNYDTYVTSNAEKELRTLLKNCYINGDYYLIEQDPELRWFEKMKYFIDSIKIYQYIFVAFIIGFIVGIFALPIVAYIDLFLIVIVFFCRFVLYYTFNFFTSKPEVIDNFKNTIDTVWEILK